MCHAQELGSYTQGQGRSQVRGQIVPKIMLLINYWTEANLINEKVCRAQDLGSYAQVQGRSQVRGQNHVSAITQKLLKQI